MTGAEIQASYFSPLHFFLYLVIILALLVAYLRWAWMKRCRDFIKVLIVRTDGSTDTKYAPKSGGYVALKNPHSNTTRMWPVNRLSAVEMLYPGDGFIPPFLQGTIKTIVVDEEDWEPLLNRGSYAELVASPDVVKALRTISEKYPEAGTEVTSLADSLSTAPTRDLVASPAVLGNLMHEKITEAVITVNKEMFDRVEGLMKRLDRTVSPAVFYVGIGLVLVGVIYIATQVVPNIGQIGELATKLDSIMQALGVPQ